MARVHGRDGQFYVGVASSSATAEALPYVKKWSMSASTDRQDATAFGDTTKVYVGGLPDASGSFEGFYDTATTQTFSAALDGDARRVYLYPTTPSTAGPYWFGTAFFDFNIDTDVAGVVSINGTWSAATPFQKVG